MPQSDSDNTVLGLDGAKLVGEEVIQIVAIRSLSFSRRNSDQGFLPRLGQGARSIAELFRGPWRLVPARAMNPGGSVLQLHFASGLLALAAFAQLFLNPASRGLCPPFGWKCEACLTVCRRGRFYALGLPAVRCNAEQ
jgi:hypothetical protein